MKPPLKPNSNRAGRQFKFFSEFKGWNNTEVGEENEIAMIFEGDKGTFSKEKISNGGAWAVAAVAYADYRFERSGANREAQRFQPPENISH